MTYYITAVLLSLSLSVRAETQSLVKAESHLNSAPQTIKDVLNSAPKTYVFTSQNNPDQSSVAYPGQIFRQVTINNLKSYMTGLKRSDFPGSANEAFKTLDSYFDYQYAHRLTVKVKGKDVVFKGSSKHKVKSQDEFNRDLEVLQGSTMDDLVFEANKKLKNKIAGNSFPLRRGALKGLNSTVYLGIDLNEIAVKKGRTAIYPEDFITALFKLTQNNQINGEDFTVTDGSTGSQTITSAVITKEGVNLAEMTNKFLHGAVSFSQAAGKYINPERGLTVDNIPGQKKYTNLEHHWDEAFGFFGAARDYSEYTDTLIAKQKSLNTDRKDGTFDFKLDVFQEKNFGLSINSGKRDLGAVSQQVNLTDEVFSAFVTGRHLITKQPKDYKTYLSDLSLLAIAGWERTIAATVIHYINSLNNEMNEYRTSKYLFENHAKYFSEMKGFAMAFQFNPRSLLSDTNFDRLHQLLQDQPVLMTASSLEVQNYQKNLMDARELLKNSFGFNQEDVANW